MVCEYIEYIYNSGSVARAFADPLIGSLLLRESSLILDSKGADIDAETADPLSEEIGPALSVVLT